MKTIAEYKLGVLQNINEVAVQFGGKKQTQFGQVVILAGGAGSGKGFVKENLLDIEGLTFDVDKLKELAINSDLVSSIVKDKTGTDIRGLDLRKPENVSKLHEILSSPRVNIIKKSEVTRFNSVALAHPARKPNLIMDVTLKNLGKLESISRNVLDLGYKKEDIHIVWVVNDIEIAIKQNKERDRVVPEEILMDTHKGAAGTMKDLLDMGTNLTKYMNGTFFLVFNKAKIDSEYIKSKSGGAFIKTQDYVQVKKRNGKQLSSKELTKRVVDKIISYVPLVNVWK